MTRKLLCSLRTSVLCVLLIPTGPALAFETLEHGLSRYMKDGEVLDLGRIFDLGRHRGSVLEEVIVTYDALLEGKSVEWLVDGEVVDQQDIRPVRRGQVTFELGREIDDDFTLAARFRMPSGRVHVSYLKVTLTAPANLLIRDPEPLREKLEAVRRDNSLPAIAASVVIGDRVVAASAVGLRKHGETVPVTRGDAFELGSVTKPVTGALIGILQESNELTLNTTIREVFPELDYRNMMRPDYRGVTVRQLLSHTSGMPLQPSLSENETDARGKDVMDRRYQYVKAAVADEPCVPPGAGYFYSGGSIIAASMAEERTGQSWERLVSERLFAPLGMRTAGFGPMATPPDLLDGPWYHKQVDAGPQPIEPDPEQYVQARAPAGRNVHCSAIDLGRFLVLVLNGANGRSLPLAPLGPATIRQLLDKVQLPGVSPDPPSDFLDAEKHCRKRGAYTAGGWMTDSNDEGDEYWHWGESRGRGRSVVRVVPDRNYATAVMTNVGGSRSFAALDQINKFLQTSLKEAGYQPEQLFKSD